MVETNERILDDQLEEVEQKTFINSESRGHSPTQNQEHGHVADERKKKQSRVG